MIEIPNAAGRELLGRLLAGNPGWEAGLEPGRPSDDPDRPVLPRLRIPSEHPTIATPLTIELGGTLQLFWHEGYFYDFLGPSKADDAFEFLRRFFAEEVRRGLVWRDGSKSGGPVEDDDPVPASEYDRVEIRSWRGNRDELGPG